MAPAHLDMRSFQLQCPFEQLYNGPGIAQVLICEPKHTPAPGRGFIEFFHVSNMRHAAAMAALNKEAALKFHRDLGIKSKVKPPLPFGGREFKLLHGHRYALGLL